MINAQGTTIEIDGYEMSSVSRVEIDIDANSLVVARITVPIESVELIDGKQVVKLAGDIVKVDG